jgi:hypothetical protein
VRAGETVWLWSILAGGVGAAVFGGLYQALRTTVPTAWLELLLLSPCLAAAQLLLVQRWPGRQRAWLIASFAAGAVSTLLIAASVGGAWNEQNATTLVVAFAAYFGSVGVGQSVAWQRPRRFALSWVAAAVAGGAALGFALSLTGSVSIPVPEQIASILASALLLGGGGRRRAADVAQPGSARSSQACGRQAPTHTSAEPIPLIQASGGVSLRNVYLA